MKSISRTQSAGRLRDAMSRGFCAPSRGMPLTAYAAPFCTERRMECAEPTKLRRKSGTWGHPSSPGTCVPDDFRGLPRTYVLSLQQISLILPGISYYDARQLPAFVEFRRNSPLQCGQTAGALRSVNPDLILCCALKVGFSVTSSGKAGRPRKAWINASPSPFSQSTSPVWSRIPEPIPQVLRHRPLDRRGAGIS